MGQFSGPRINESRLYTVFSLVWDFMHIFMLYFCGNFNAWAPTDSSDDSSKGINSNFFHPSLKYAYQAIQELQPKSAHSVTINKSNGTPCMLDTEILDRWREHFQVTRSCSPAPTCRAMDIPAPPTDPDIFDDALPLKPVLVVRLLRFHVHWMIIILKFPILETVGPLFDVMRSIIWLSATHIGNMTKVVAT